MGDIVWEGDYKLKEEKEEGRVKNKTRMRRRKRRRRGGLRMRPGSEISSEDVHLHL